MTRETPQEARAMSDDVITIGTRVTVHDMNQDVPEDHDGNGTVIEIKPALMGRLLPMYYVLFDGVSEDYAAWFYADEFELLHDRAAHSPGPAPSSDLAELQALRSALTDVAGGDCAFMDDCPASPRRRETCARCFARRALEGAASASGSAPKEDP